jgi:tRNA A-37 threonylcarbamoyl transferase component Bud32
VWYADAEAASRLGGWVEILCAPQAAGWARVKHNASRSVFRGTIDGQAVYLKQFHPQSRPRRLARRLGASGALREVRWAQYLAAHGVVTPAPLAAMCRGGVEWCLTRAVAPAAGADAWHARQLRRGPAGVRSIRRATVALAGLVGRMHAAGVRHGDLHCGNVLVRGGDHRPELVLMDLHRVRGRRRLPRRARAANLAHLLHDRLDFTTRTDRLRFLKHYLRASGAEGTLRGWQLLVERLALRYTPRQLAQRDRRVLGRNRYFCPIRLGRGWRGHVVLASKRRLAGSRAAELEFDVDQWRQALGDPGRLTEADDAEVVKDTRSSLVVRRRLTIGGRRLHVYVKRPRRKRPWKALVDCVRPSKALRAFGLGHMLLTRRVPTALPLAALERRTGPVLRDALLITEAVCAPSLHDFLKTWLATPPRGDVRLTVPQQRHLAQQVLWQLGRLVQRLHDRGFAHRDLKATNLLVRWSPGRSPDLVLVDLDGLRRRRLLTTRRRFQGLMRLNVSLLQCPEVNHAGRLRMLLGYLRRPGSGRIAFKPFWRVLEDWSASKLDQQIRSRRRRQRQTRRPAP